MQDNRLGRRALMRIAAFLGFGSFLFDAGRVEAVPLKPGSLEGAWLTKITGVTPKPFQVTGVYAAGGVFVGSGTVDEQPPSAPAYGAWIQTGPAKFRSHLVFWTYEKSGAANGIVHFREEINLSADSNRYQATCEQKVYDFGSHLLSTASGTEVAERVKA